MSTQSPTTCPFHGDALSPVPASHRSEPPSLQGWPSGPPSRLTGWSHLARMSRDLPAALEGWHRDHGDLVHLRIWPEHQVIVAHPELARELLVTHHDALIRWERGTAVFSRFQGRSLFVAEGEEWRSRRQSLQPAFQHRAMQGFVPAIAGAAGQMLAGWPADGGVCEVGSGFTALAMDVIVRMLFSTPLGGDARLAEEAVQVLLRAADAELYRPVDWPDWVPWRRSRRRALATLHGLIDRHLWARLELSPDRWPDDLLTRLLHAHRGEGTAWTPEELRLEAVRDECMTIFLAGHETTAATLVWWAWCMAANPAAQDAAREEVRRVLNGQEPTAGRLAELTYLRQTIQETMRLYPAAPVLSTRRATRPITLGGWRFPARTLFLLPVQAIQHDARWFPDPLAFRPERFVPDAPPAPRGAHMPFGAGPRVCLGQHLAMTELTAIAAMLLQRFAVSVPAGMAPPRPVMRLSLRPDKPLRLHLSPVTGG
ncbi:cytochrome P450 [Azospirillum palustre]